jgi:hypothetical protein
MSDKKFTREVIGTIVLVRDGVRKVLTTGMRFDFTESELNEINASNPKALSSKTIVDLDTGDVDMRQMADTDAPQPPKTEKAPKGKKGASDNDDM